MSSRARSGAEEDRSFSSSSDVDDDDPRRTVRAARSDPVAKRPRRAAASKAVRPKDDEDEDSVDHDNDHDNVDVEEDGMQVEDEDEDDLGVDEQSFLEKTALEDEKRRAAAVEMRRGQLRKSDAAPMTAASSSANAAAAEASAEPAASSQAEARLNFLLRQTELFSHFLTGTVRGRGGAGADGPRRKRISEKEEDEDLMRDERTEEGTQSAGYHTRLLVQPAWIKFGKLREYQMQGLNWLVSLYENNVNGILADEMGLGKTLQTLSLLGYLKYERGMRGPHLIIVPKSTLTNWKNEATRWIPGLRVFKFHEKKAERAAMVAEHLVPAKMQYDIVITTYELVSKERAALSKFKWKYIVIDEAHRIKNEDSLLSQVVRAYSSEYRLLITGTPLQNNLHELWALLNFLLPDVFSSSSDFDSWFDVSALQEKDKQQEVVSKLHKVLRPFMLRRKKVDVERSLPPKKEIKLYVGLSPLQREWYVNILSKDIEAINGVSGVKGHGRLRLLNLVMQLRKCANHPYLFDGAEPGPPYVNGEHIVSASAKLVLLDKLLPRLKSRDSRVLIFSQMTRMLDLLDDYLHLRGYEYCRIDGSTEGDARDAAIDAYNAPGSTKFVFLLSTRAGGLGINLATADTVILYDSDWNPQMDLQAQDRAHRIGQTRPVTVYRFVTEGTVEEKITDRAEAKLHLDALVIQQGRLVEQQKAVSGEELLAMVRFGADQIFKGTGQPLTDQDIDAIIAHGEEKTAQLTDRLTNQEKTLLDDLNLGEGAGGSHYVFEGVDFKERQRKEPLDWLGPQARQRHGRGGHGEESHARDTRSGGVTNPIASSSRRGGQKLAKLPILHDYQFYPPQLLELLEKERHALVLRREWEEKNSGPTASTAADEKPDAAGADAAAAEAPDFGDLTYEERELKERLLAQGFGDWSRRDFAAFAKASELHGSTAFDEIASAIGTKTPDEVRRYAAVFWQRLNEVKGGDRLAQLVERGEERIARRKEIANVLETKYRQYEQPWREMSFAYPHAPATRAYTEEEDRFLVCSAHKVGYGNWDALRRAIRREPVFRFDWFIKSRSTVDLQRRVDALIRIIEKELDPSEVQTTATTGSRSRRR